MDTAELLARFDRERREDPPAMGAYGVEKTAHLTRLVTASKTFVLWSRIPFSQLVVTIEREKAGARAEGRSIVWKLYAHDPQPDVATALAGAGFRPKPHETLMLFDLAREIPAGAPAPGLDVRPVLEDDVFQDYAAIDRAAFGAPPAPSDAPRAPHPVDPRVGLFIAYVDGVPASVGRVELAPGHALAGLFGGGTSPAFRRRGIYRELVKGRAAWARERGARALFTEAVDSTSRPILERLGFVPVAGVETWGWEVAENVQIRATLGS